MVTTTSPLDVELSIGLAVTARCCTKDLSADPDAALEELAAHHPVVTKFVSLRSQDEEGQETIRSVRGPLPVFELHAGRVRGATCPDRRHSVVWLLASHMHRAGERSDAYPYFERLHQQDVLFPTEEDYDRLFRRRNAAAIPTIISRLEAVLLEARDQPGNPQTVLLPGGVVVTVVIMTQQPREELPALEEMWLSVSTEGLQPSWLSIIQAALSVGDDDRPFEYRQDFPGRGPNRRELRFRYWQEVH